jgi:hypothetical protein
LGRPYTGREERSRSGVSPVPVRSPAAGQPRFAVRRFDAWRVASDSECGSVGGSLSYAMDQGLTTALEASSFSRKRMHGSELALQGGARLPVRVLFGGWTNWRRISTGVLASMRRRSDKRG